METEVSKQKIDISEETEKHGTCQNITKARKWTLLEKK